MVDVFTQIVIAAPLDKVSEYVANPDNAPDWYVNIKSVEWETPKPMAVGSRIAFKAAFAGRQLAYVYEVVDFSPGKKLVMKTFEGPFPMETTYTWETITENTTRMTLRNKGNPTGFSKLFSPFMTSMMKRANMKDLKRVKDIMENQF